MLTDYQCYRSMSWTTDSDECENDCGIVMCEENYVEGRRGHYCSIACRDDAEDSGGADSWHSEREDFHSDG